MGLETADTIYELNEANPDGTDDRPEGDNHLRLIKDAIKKTFLKGLEANRPAAGTEGRYYIATDTLKHFYDNGSSWGTLGPDPEPAGILSPFAGSSAPTGYLLCDGSAVSRTTYDTLFGVIGTTYGVGDGSTTFNVPDLRGRFPLGKDNMGGSSANRVTAAAADSLGGAAGAENHTLTTAEMPAHAHTGTAQSAGLHHHGTGPNSHTANVGEHFSTRGLGQNNAGAHTHTLSINNTGGGNSHNNMPPYITLNWLIKT